MIIQNINIRCTYIIFKNNHPNPDGGNSKSFVPSVFGQEG